MQLRRTSVELYYCCGKHGWSGIRDDDTLTTVDHSKILATIGHGKTSKIIGQGKTLTTNGQGKALALAVHVQGRIGKIQEEDEKNGATHVYARALCEY